MEIGSSKLDPYKTKESLLVGAQLAEPGIAALDRHKRKIAHTTIRQLLVFRTRFVTTKYTKRREINEGSLGPAPFALFAYFVVAPLWLWPCCHIFAC